MNYSRCRLLYIIIIHFVTLYVVVVVISIAVVDVFIFKIVVVLPFFDATAVRLILFLLINFVSAFFDENDKQKRKAIGQTKTGTNKSQRKVCIHYDDSVFYEEVF